MGCAGSNHIDNAANQAIEIANAGELKHNEEVSLEESKQIYKPCNEEDEACVSFEETEADMTNTIMTSDSAIDEAFYTEVSYIDIVPRQPDTDKVIYLTFDDGPSNNTQKILDILQHENIKATFFVTGHHENYVYMIKREFEAGHAIGAHSYTHKYEIYTSQETYFDDLERLQKVIEKYTGSRTKLIRFPGGSSNNMYSHYNADPNFMRKLCKTVRRRGYQYFDWNLSSKDSRNSYVPASTIVTMSCRDTGRAICLLLHDSFGKESTVAALPSIIRYYKEKGYRFGTLDNTSPGFHHF